MSSLTIGRTTYTVQRCDAPEVMGGSYYKLRGPRGAAYNLYRNRENSQMLWSVNQRTGHVGGIGWIVEDADGALRPSQVLR